MKDLLKSDFYRFVHNKACILLPVLAFVFSFVSSWSVQVMDSAGINTYLFGYVPQGSFAAHALPAVSTAFAILMVLFSAWFISPEFVQNTMRNAVCTGKSRIHVYFSKMIVMTAGFVLCLCIALCVFAVMFTRRFGFGSIDGMYVRTLKMLGLNLLLNVHYIGIVCMIPFLLRSIQGAMTAGLLIIIAESVFPSIVMFFEEYKGIVDFLPAHYVSRINFELANTPFIIKGIGLNVAVFVITTAIGCLVFRRADIK